MQQTAQFIEIKMSRQEIFATEIDDGLMPGFAGVVAISFHDTHIFVLNPALAAGSSDYPQEHRRHCLKLCLRYSAHLTAIRNRNLGKMQKKLSLQIRAQRLVGYVFSMT